MEFKMPRSRKGKEKDCDRESKKKKIDVNKDVDPELWHVLAGRVVQLPKVNSSIFYFPQGHAEHACEPVHFSADSKIPSQIPCRVAAIHYRADPDTDEVYAKLSLVPLNNSEVSFDDDAVGDINDTSVTRNKYEFYTKELTLSDTYSACNGFCCPKVCAETIFPSLDYLVNPNSQHIYPTDVHGKTWEFKHVYRGPHQLTTGWSKFVSEKQLDCGDSIVFLRAENNDLHIGIRRSKRRNDFGFNPSREKDDKPQNTDKVKAEDVLEAVRLGVNMQPFDVVYYPRVGTPEFFVKTSLIRKALQIRWCQGMKFKMPTETEVSPKTRLCVGTIASVEAADPAWPDSLWRLLQVIWDLPDLTANTERLNPWQVEIIQDISPFLPQFITSPMDGQFSLPTFPNNFQTPTLPMFPLPETTTAGMLGAMHDHFSHNKLDFHLENIPLDNPELQKESTSAKDSRSISVSTQPSEKLDHAKPTQIVLFGKTIQIDSENENAEKKITSSSSDPLQHLP